MGPIPLKIIDQDPRISTDVTEIYGLSTFPEKQQTVKDLKKLPRRLVDRAQDGHALFCEAPKGGNNRPGTLRVEARSRLIEEDQ